MADMCEAYRLSSDKSSCARPRSTSSSPAYSRILSTVLRRTARARWKSGGVKYDVGDVNQVLSEHFHRRVKLARAAPEDFTIDQYHPDIEGADPGGNRNTVVEHLAEQRHL